MAFAIAAAVLLACYVIFVAALALAGRRTGARAIAGFIPDGLVLLKRLLGDSRIPRSRRALVVAAIGYLAMPIDLVPDVIPVAGQLDDAIVLVLVLRAVLRAAGPDTLREHWPGPESSLRLLTRHLVRPEAGR
jgi:uncharacterized membrane protein YkvA (DUF1232 family)